FRKSVEGIYDWGRNLDLKLRCVRVLDIAEFPELSGPQEFKGRPIVPNIKPSHLLAIHYWTPPAERNPDGFGPATFAYSSGVGQVDGKWWCTGAKYAKPVPEASEPSGELAEPLSPLGEELSKVPGVSLKRSEGPV